eukprot:7246946-Pyramimonas_sp.AAC.1
MGNSPETHRNHHHRRNRGVGGNAQRKPLESGRHSFPVAAKPKQRLQVSGEPRRTETRQAPTKKQLAPNGACCVQRAVGAVVGWCRRWRRRSRCRRRLADALAQAL